MQAKIIHATLTSQEFLPRLWPASAVFGTIPAEMAAKIESPESVAAVAERLRMTRLAFDMNVATWCRMVGITPQAWAGVEGTKNTPAKNRIALDQALLVCKATGVSLDWIYRGHRDNLPLKVALALQKLESPAPRKAGKAR